LISVCSNLLPIFPRVSYFLAIGLLGFLTCFGYH
jgi:hypothetical protein